MKRKERIARLEARIRQSMDKDASLQAAPRRRAPKRRSTEPESPSGPYLRECAARLHRNMRDPDALFVLAAHFASRGNAQGGVATLNLLTAYSPHHPGLWRFKARLHRELGNHRLEALCLVAAEREEARA